MKKGKKNLGLLLVPKWMDGKVNNKVKNKTKKKKCKEYSLTGKQIIIFKEN